MPVSHPGELTKAGETIVHQGVTIIGPVNMASDIPYHASQMYSANVNSFLKLMIGKEGVLKMNREDEIIRETLVTSGGEVVHARVGELMGLTPAAPAAGGR